MAVINLTTGINAPIQRCFDLSRSIDLHQVSTKGSNEKAIAGRTSGLIEEGEFVTWEATHFLLRQKLSTLIIKVNAPEYFFDRMIDGPFMSMEHSHSFHEGKGNTIMTDVFNYKVPLGMMGKLFDKIILKKYMTKLLTDRNEVIRETAESEEWKKFI